MTSADERALKRKRPSHRQPGPPPKKAAKAKEAEPLSKEACRAELIVLYEAYTKLLDPTAQYRSSSFQALLDAAAGKVLLEISCIWLFRNKGAKAWQATARPAGWRRSSYQNSSGNLQARSTAQRGA